MAMTNYTGFEWLLIDAANNFGHDKMLFEERIEWARANLDNLEALAVDADAKTVPLYRKAVMAIRKAQAGIPTGHLVGVDAVCSGIQIMSVLTGCIEGARSTGLVNPNERADAYTKCTTTMGVILGGDIEVPRKHAKNALMTSFYGSKAQPKHIFGEDTPELDAFYQAAQQIAPGAWELLQDLLKSWQAYELLHAWKLPDGYDARVKVMDKKEVRIEVDELGHSTFSYEFYENVGMKNGLSNVANVTHSMDAYVLRSMHRRCNYDREVAENADRFIQVELMERQMQINAPAEISTDKMAYYIEQYNRSGIADVVILPHLDSYTVRNLSNEHLEKLASIVSGMLQYKPFALVTVHDEFKAHPNNVNWVRWQYKEILADIAESNVIDDIYQQITGLPGTFQKLSFNLADIIRNESNYGLC